MSLGSANPERVRGQLCTRSAHGKAKSPVNCPASYRRERHYVQWFELCGICRTCTRSGGVHLAALLPLGSVGGQMEGRAPCALLASDGMLCSLRNN
jgi:hypothetical protein